jgi:hypothetical protein
MPPGPSAPVGAASRLNPYDFMGLVPEAEGKAPYGKLADDSAAATKGP